MQIRKIKIKGLYGYIDKEIDFNPDINLLVGINGSGKTSVLNLIYWLLTPSLPNLCVTEFEQVDLQFQFKKDEYLLVSKQDKTEITLELTNISQNITYNKIQTTFKIHPTEISRNESKREEYMTHYTGMTPDNSEKESWLFLNSTIPNPVIIGLDRYLFTEEGEDVRVMAERKFRSSFDDSRFTNTPLQKVLDLTRRNYGTYRSRIIDLNVRLNNKIMLSSFDDVYDEDGLLGMLQSEIVTLNQVEILQEKVVKYFEENEVFNRNVKNQSKTDDALKRVDSYFTNLKKIILDTEKSNDKKSQSFGLLYLTNINQFKKIVTLIKEFEDFENDFKLYERPIKEFLDSINQFFRDSSKEIYFERDSSELKFNILNKNGKIVLHRRDIRGLSSGEQQILIMFTYLKFYSSEGKLFILDEPELSLHPKWQEEFLDKVIKLTPKGTQIMIATHSPAIVGRHENFCKVLFPYNEI